MVLTSVLQRKSFLSKQLYISFLILCGCSCLALGQSVQMQSRQISAAITDPASMRHMYFLFFSYQQHLDQVAANAAAAGKDASGLREALQRQLHFSDADYAPVRDSAQRLASEEKSRYDDAKIHPLNKASLPEYRDRDVQAEMDALTNLLSPQNKAALDALIVQMFTPRPVVQKGAQR